jgi:hypothetical protein
MRGVPFAGVWKMKLADLYDSQYTTRSVYRGDKTRPAITVQRAKDIFAAAKFRMNPHQPCKINASLTNEHAFDILVKAIDGKGELETLDSLISRNIVRTFGHFLTRKNALR